jgi:hypothetical protein
MPQVALAMHNAVHIGELIRESPSNTSCLVHGHLALKDILSFAFSIRAQRTFPNSRRGLTSGQVSVEAEPVK